jgi:immune inhibitor A
MRRLIRLGVAAVLVLALAVTVGALSASAAGGRDRDTTRDGKTRKHDFETVMSKRQRDAREDGLERKAHGKFDDGQRVGRLFKKRYVELELEKTDRIFVVLAEFGDEDHAAYPVIPEAGAVRFDGPLHNEIPKPNRRVDNTTLWQSDFNTAHYDNMYFNRMAEYYKRQSSGRYTVEGDVVEWVKVPFNERRYGSNDCDVDGDIQIGVAGSADSIVCSNVWFLIRDAMAFWVQQQLDANGGDMAAVQNYLKTFDVGDRYDIDGDGNFDEPDGVIDHFQIVHSGGDEAAGDPTYGQDAIWSHRWATQLHTGCPYDPFGVLSLDIGRGGVSSGQTIPDNPTGICVYDYTIQPENGGLGVFAHEYGHDLGLPDLYDTSGNTGGAENSTGFWTLMSSGANIGDGGRNGIGDDPVDLGAWEKWQLGWLNTGFVEPDKEGTFNLGPAEFNTTDLQGLVVTLPDKELVTDLGDPFDGPDYYYSSAGDNLDNVMYRNVALAAAPTLTAKVRYEIEEEWDYAYVVVRTAGSTAWTGVPTNLSSTAGPIPGGPNGQNFGNGITGSSAGQWVDLTADLSAYAGQTVDIGFRYWTDGAVVESGLQVDLVDIDGAGDPGGWTFVPAEGGFRVTTGQETSFHFNAYLAENRLYTSYDRSLKTAYNFGFLDKRPDWVESYPYQDGVLISYFDTSQNDNNVGDHPGQGLLLPVDAHPQPLHWADGWLMRPRIQTYDSTFGHDRTDRITLHKDSKRTVIQSQRAVSTFDDTKSWWSASDGHAHDANHSGPASSHDHYQVGWIGVNVPQTGTSIRVRDTSQRNGTATLEVRRKK